MRLRKSVVVAVAVICGGLTAAYGTAAEKVMRSDVRTTPSLSSEVGSRFKIGQPHPVGEVTNSIGMKLVRVPAGDFLMGSSAEEIRYWNDWYRNRYGVQHDGSYDGRQHRVRITQPFYLGRYEVTRDQFRRFVQETGYRTKAEKDDRGGYGYDGDGVEEKTEYSWRNVGFEQADDHPVVNVSWNDAVAFCQWLTRKEGATYRLPTEAEWEYACRAGTTTRYYHGDDENALACVGNVADETLVAKLKMPDGNHIQASDGYVFTAPVGRFLPNGFGLYDLHGNVWEWCADWFCESYQPNSPAVDPSGPKHGAFRVSRGGSWSTAARFCRSAYCFPLEPDYRHVNLGFCVARVADE